MWTVFVLQLFYVICEEKFMAIAY